MSTDLNELLDEALDGQTADGQRRPPDPAPVLGVRPWIGKVRYSHDAMVDMIIADPTISQNRLAAHFGYTAAWVSRVITSDAFQARLAERAGELVDPTIKASVEQRFKGLVLRSLEIMEEKLNRPTAAIPDQLALRTLEVSSRAAGYGARVEAQVRPAVDLHVHLEQLGENLTKLLQRRRSELEGERFEKLVGESEDAQLGDGK